MNRSFLIGGVFLARSVHCSAQDGWITLSGRQFLLDGQPFYPRVINFGMELVALSPPVSDVAEVWSSVESSYDWTFQQFDYNTEAALSQQAADHFAKIRSMGFNAVRMGLPARMHWDGPNGPRHYSVTYLRHGWWEPHTLDMDMNGFQDTVSIRHFQLIRELIRLADAEGLKVILLCAEDTGGQTQLTPATDAQAAQDYANYLYRLGEELKDEPGLLAYDLWNEPIWTNFAMNALSKNTVCDYTTQWYDTIRSAGDGHLITLGGSSISELGSWDPAIMKLDFYSPHIYPLFSPLDGYDVQGAFDRMYAKIHWQARACPIPWMIGEIGFAAEDDGADPKDLHQPSSTPRLIPDAYTHRMPYMMGSELQQAEFFTNSMDAVRANMGSGYSWWGFQNGRNHPLLRVEDFDPANLAHIDAVATYHHNFWGPLKYGNPGSLGLPAPWNGENRWRDKAMVATMQNYPLPPAPAEMPPPPSNYYNWYNLNTNVWRDGYIKDQNDQPVADAVIEVPWEYLLDTEEPPPMPAWTFTEWMSYVTDENGYFSIRNAPGIDGFGAPSIQDGFSPSVNAAGAVKRTVGGSGTTTFVVREVLPYSTTVDVLVESNELEVYKGRYQLEVTSGTVEGGENGGRADLFATQAVHISAPFHAEVGSTIHVFTDPVFAECPGEGSGMTQEPNEPSASHGTIKSRPAIVQLRFDLQEVEVSAFPSPASDRITLQCTVAGFSYRIFDRMGKLVREGQSHSEQTSLDVSSLTPGVYQCSIASPSHSAHTSFTITR